jgi:hypothetical protein
MPSIRTIVADLNLASNKVLDKNKLVFRAEDHRLFAECWVASLKIEAKGMLEPSELS